jgi:hypothetical protein
VRGDEAGQVPDQRTVRQQRTLGIARGACRIGKDGRIVRKRDHRLERAFLAGNQGAPGQAVVVFSGDADDLPEHRAAVEHRLQLGHAAVIDQRNACFAVAQPIFKRVCTQQRRQGQHDRPQLEDGQISHQGFRPLGQHDGNTVAALHAHAPQSVGQAVGIFLQPGECPHLAIAGFVFAVKRDPSGVHAGTRPAVATCFRDIEALRNPPPERGIEFVILVFHNSPVRR